MATRANIPWLRICAEGVVIVVSILSALAADAWWDERQERSREREIVAALLEDFVENSQRIDSVATLHRSRRVAVEQLLEAVRASGQPNLDSIAVWSSRLYQGHTVEVAEGTLTALLGSGDLAVIQNDSLRVLLSGWPAQMTDFHEIEQIAVDVLFDDVYPATRDHVPVPNIAGFARPPPTPLDDQALQFMRGRAFENLLRQTIFIERYIESDAATTIDHVESIVSLLRSEL